MVNLCAQIMVLEGLHPFYDERVRDLYDFKIYLDISDEVKFAWKIQRDMKERGHSLESIKASIEARRPDFDAYIDPQKKHADVIIQVTHLLCVHFISFCLLMPCKSSSWKGISGCRLQLAAHDLGRSASRVQLCGCCLHI